MVVDFQGIILTHIFHILQIHVHHLQTPSTDQKKWKNLPPLPNAAEAFQRITKRPTQHLFGWRAHLPRGLLTGRIVESATSGVHDLAIKNAFQQHSPGPKIFRHKFREQWKQTFARWFKVPFSSPSWRSLNPLKGSLNHPKKVTAWITWCFFCYSLVLFFCAGIFLGEGWCPIRIVVERFRLKKKMFAHLNQWKNKRVTFHYHTGWPGTLIKGLL